MLLKLSSKILQGQLARFGRAPKAPIPRADDNLPFNIRIGTIVKIPASSVAQLQGTLMRVPDATQGEIVGISRLKLDSNKAIEIFRFFFDRGENRKGLGETFLQVTVNNGNVLDAGYYQFLTRMHPRGEEIEAYIGRGYGLGEKEYFMEQDQLSASGFNPEQIDDLLHGETALEFRRDAPTSDEYVKPYGAKETRIDDNTGEIGLKQTVSFMPYVRELAGGYTENLLISFEHVSSFDGFPAGDTHVDFMVGISIDPQRLSVY